MIRVLSAVAIICRERCTESRPFEAALLVFTAAAARTRIVAADLLRLRGEHGSVRDHLRRRRQRVPGRHVDIPTASRVFSLEFLPVIGPSHLPEKVDDARRGTIPVVRLDSIPDSVWA